MRQKNQNLQRRINQSPLTHTVIPHNLITFRLQASDVTWLKRWLRQLSLHQRCASHATTSQDETCRGFKRNTKTSVTLHQKQSLSIQCTSIILTLNIEQCNVILHLTSQWFHYKVSITTTNDGYTMHLPGWFVLTPARNHNWYPPLDMKSCLIRHSIPELCGSM